MAQNPADRVLKVLQISDTHLHAAADGRMRGRVTYATFLSVLEHAKHDRRWAPDVILATGDVVQDESRAGYERFRASLEPLGIPVVSIPGNHDDPNLMAEILASGKFQLGGEVRLGKWSLLQLSTYLAGEDAGGLGPARLTGLRKALAAHTDQHVLIAMHHHPLPMGSSWLDGVALRDAAAFWEIVDANPHVRVVVCGHVHQASDRERNGVRFLSTPSTCAQFLPGSAFFALDERPPGLRWLELHPDGRVETEVAWVPQRATA
jgi:3',5'-cyclic-AMP phosphodiesterase